MTRAGTVFIRTKKVLTELFGTPGKDEGCPTCHWRRVDRLRTSREQRLTLCIERGFRGASAAITATRDAQIARASPAALNNNL
jgi:hypothetical protein